MTGRTGKPVPGVGWVGPELRGAVLLWGAALPVARFFGAHVLPSVGAPPTKGGREGGGIL